VVLGERTFNVLQQELLPFNYETRAIGFVTLSTKVTFSTIINAFLVKKAKKAFGK
jgi:hypothetical protein